MCATIVAVALAYSLPASTAHCAEAKYKGRTFAEWVERARSEYPAARCDAAEALRTFGPAAVPTLRGLARDKDKNVRFVVAWALASIPAALPTIEGMLKDKDSAIRLAAARALWEVDPRNKATIPALTELLKDKDLDVRTDAAGALGKIGTKARAVVPALVEMFTDDKPEARCAAAEAVGFIEREGGAAVPAPHQIDEG